jgi:CubicO group peptidase (beta-lactamase class C family)
LPEPGKGFLYNDEGPMLATGMIAYTARETALRFGEENLFAPLEFRNVEWMHEDAAGIDNGGYGLRIRPIDMQKFGVLYLNRGLWHEKQIVPTEWVDTTFSPWNRASPGAAEPNYGWFWWARDFGPGWKAHVAQGWKGQRIIVIPGQGVVVTVTGYMSDGEEDAVPVRIVEDYVVPSVEHGRGKALAADPQATAELARVLGQARRAPMRGPRDPEPRMIPSIEPKAQHRDSIEPAAMSSPDE